MQKINVVLLSESRLVNPIEKDDFINNVLLEDEILSKALIERGISTERVDWANKDYDWERTAIILVRSTWDYHDKWNEFLSFLKEMKDKVKFINPIETLIWSMDKHYLLDLEKKNVHIVKSLIIEKDAKIKLAEAAMNFNKEEIILKPCISAGARHTYRIKKSRIAEYESIFKSLIEEEAMIIQEFQDNIVIKGEVSLMYFDGKFSHAILKKAKEGDFRVQDDFGGSVHDYIASDEEIQFGLYTINQIDPVPIYGRVDICEDNNKEIALIELELIEPELWFRNAPESANILADAILKELN